MARNSQGLKDLIQSGGYLTKGTGSPLSSTILTTKIEQISSELVAIELMLNDLYFTLSLVYRRHSIDPPGIDHRTPAGYRTIMSSRSGPVPIHLILHWTNFSMYST